VGNIWRVGKADGTLLHTPYVRGVVLLALRKRNSVVSRFAKAVQPVVFGNALGKNNASIPSRARVFVAGRAYRPRNRGRISCGSFKHFGYLLRNIFGYFGYAMH
jgi:hypothetical protein